MQHSRRGSTGARSDQNDELRMMIGKQILIVGGGIAGLLTAWALARRGVAVTVFEQGPLPNPHSSSFDEHRIIRHAYGAMEGYARLMPGPSPCGSGCGATSGSAITRRQALPISCAMT
jgi:NADPH-dependent 2,4-dienoyl-CoA reductase/sulfur reductase-like enzyme